MTMGYENDETIAHAAEIFGDLSTVTAWTTRGPVRGPCGHRHKTLRAALECVDRDGAACRKVGGYSDRSVVAIRDARVWSVSDDCGGRWWDA
jgi:hypothetical protein